jgi:hypothetical protein
VGLEWGPLSLVSVTEELLEWKSSCSGSRKPRLTAVETRCADTLYPQKLTLTSPASGGRSVGIVRLRTKATEFSLVPIYYLSKQRAHVGDDKLEKGQLLRGLTNIQSQ